jgi:hypothetical protein
MCKLVHAFRWEYSCKSLKLAQLLGKLGAFLTCRAEAASSSSGLLPGHPWLQLSSGPEHENCAWSSAASSLTTAALPLSLASLTFSKQSKHAGLCEHTRARCHSSLKFVAPIGIPRTEENGEAS